MEWDTLLLATLPIVATLVTLVVSHHYERQRASEDRRHELDRVALEQTHAMVARLFEQRFQTYADVLHLAHDVVELKTTEAEVAEPRSDDEKLRSASRALMDELDRAMLLATDPVRTALRDLYRKSLVAPRPTTDDLSNPFRSVAGQIVAARDYAMAKEHLSELMSRELRGFTSDDRSLSE